MRGEPKAPGRRIGEWPAAMLALQSDLYRDHEEIREWVDDVRADYDAFGTPRPTCSHTHPRACCASRFCFTQTLRRRLATTLQARR